MRKITLFLLIASFSTLNAQTNGTLTVTVTTATAGGDYSNKNAVAIWVQNSSNQIQKTLLLNCTNGHGIAAEMSQWYAAIGGAWANFSNYKDVDGVTSATNSNYGTKTAYWGKTVNISTVPDGTYTVKMELLDGGGNPAVNATGHKVASFTFTKGATAQTLTPTDVLPSFKSINISWVPVVSGLDDVEYSKLYSIYPNPAKSDVYVNGPDIKFISIYNLEGKRVMYTTNQKVDVSSLVKGEYIMTITNSNNNINRKLIKN